MNVKKLRSLLSLVLALVLALAEGPALKGRALEPVMAPMAAITVNSEGDEGDPHVSDGICDITGDPDNNPPVPYSGICTLRAAIQTANETAGADTITFAAGVSTIKPAGNQGLPTITSQVTINGASGGSRVELDGSNTTWYYSIPGLDISGPDSTVTGMVINSFPSNGIRLSGSGSHTITNNYIGTDTSGTVAKPNDSSGILVGTPNATIGGATPEERNVVSGNDGTGIVLDAGSSNCAVIGNYIGVDVSGTAALGNSGSGILIETDGHTIGGTTPGERNIISGNGDSGVLVYDNASNNTIQGNYVGTDKDGLLDVGNSKSGIWVHMADDNTIGGAVGAALGGPCTGACNLVSGNDDRGIRLVTAGAATRDPATGNTIQGNFVGTTVDGTAALGNLGDGVYGIGIMTNTITGNLISANTGSGIYLGGGSSNIVRGNLIGTDTTGTAALGNAVDGVYTSGNNVIGGSSGDSLPARCEDYCNLISGNGWDGVWLAGDGNSVIGNFIGTDINGTAWLGNDGPGISVFESFDNVVAHNLISANSGDGVNIVGEMIAGGLSSANATIVQANLIGTARDGTSNRGNGGYGVYVHMSSSNRVGGDQDGQGNTIAFNVKTGVAISRTQAIDNRILRNSIHSNGGWSGLGIDLKEDGVTENDLGDGDTGPNKLQNLPAITGIKGNVVSGTLNSTPNTIFRLEFFANSECSTGGYGQGETFLGSFDVATDGSGNVTFAGTLDTAPGWQPVTATATDPDGNTSEFSACFGGLVVNSVGDLPDASTLDPACDTGQKIAGGDPECTLRAAIEQAHVLPGRNTITFDIPNAPGVPIIFPASALPTIIEPVVINGTTQAGGWVELSGIHAGDDVSGLDIFGGDSLVQGLIIGQFDGHGILLQNAGGNVVIGNLIGVAANDVWAGNGRNGIRIQSGSSNTIGGTTTAERNVIANNGWRTNASGIYIGPSSDDNVIQGNTIGANQNGDTAAGNTWAGVYIENASGNTVGGTTGVSTSACTGACNLISGNKYGVVLKSSQAATNTVLGNFIGTNRAGTAALGNTSYGVVVDGAPNNLIGGTSSAARNLISGNGIAGTEGDGVIIGNATATGNKVQGNTIGTKANGTEALPNARNGVRIDNAPNNTVGGSHGANLISGNTGNGVEITGAGATGNSVQANRIGTNGSGTAALPNGGSGVLIDGAPDNTVGGIDLGNLVSGNTGNGVEITGAGATGNKVQANLIGTNDSGTAALPNGGSGVFINGAPGNTVGGDADGQGNVLSGNSGSGVEITGEGADDNVVQGNLIGTDGSGTVALANATDGVHIDEGATATQVGGWTEGEANVISGNGSDGVEINGIGTINHVVQGNFIGTLEDGVTGMANAAHGVHIAGGANSNTIGGIVTPTANIIAFNGGDGVYVASGKYDSIRRNAIHSNAGMGIDLGTNGVTPNDPGDGDSGANYLQNFPVITSLVISDVVATIEGTLDSTAAMTFTLEFFANTSCDPALHGEGERFLGAITVTTNADGHADFAFTPSAPVSDTEKVAATATHADNHTSEFSRCARPTERVAVVPAVGHRLVLTDTQGNPIIVEIPASAITYTEPITLAYALIEDEVSGPASFAFGNRAFELSAYLGNKLLSGLVFSKPVTVTIYYSDADVAGLDEEQLTLLYHDGAVWAGDGIDVVERNSVDGYVIFTIAHLSDFGLFSPQRFEVYLPLILR